MNKYKDCLATSTTIIMTENLQPAGTYLRVMYEKMEPAPYTWRATYTSNSAYHICPFDGNFRKCESCRGIEEMEDTYCLTKQQFVSTKELEERIKMYINGGGKLEYY